MKGLPFILTSLAWFWGVRATHKTPPKRRPIRRTSCPRMEILEDRVAVSEQLGAFLAHSFLLADVVPIAALPTTKRESVFEDENPASFFKQSGSDNRVMALPTQHTATDPLRLTGSLDVETSLSNPSEDEFVGLLYNGLDLPQEPIPGANTGTGQRGLGAVYDFDTDAGILSGGAFITQSEAGEGASSIRPTVLTSELPTSQAALEGIAGPPVGSVFRTSAPSAPAAVSSPPLATARSSSASAARRYTPQPLRFEPNQGQTGAVVRFVARGKGYNLLLTSNEAVLVLQRPVRPAGAPTTAPASARSVLRLQLVGANPQVQVRGVEPLPGRTNYLHGNPAQWRLNAIPFNG